MLKTVPLPQESTPPPAGPRRLRQRSKNRRWISTLLILAGVIVIGYPTLTEAYGYFVQYRLNENWDKELSRQGQIAASAELEQIGRLGDRAVSSEDDILKQAVDIVKTDVSAEFPATKIKIPKIGVEQVILADVDSETLKSGPGHYRGTANPGQRGTIGIAGHRVTYTRPFNRLDELVPGDRIILETLDDIFEYRVVKSETLDPDDLSALVPKKDNRARLTLTTCTPKYSARFRLDVQASLVGATPRRTPTILRRLVKNIAPSEPQESPQNMLDLATRQAQEGVALDPMDPGARIALGSVYRRIGRLDDAIIQLQRAVVLGPTNAIAHYELASIHKKMGDTDLAIDSLNRAIRVDPGLEAAYYRLGNLYLEIERPKKAVDTLGRALELSPLAGDTHYYIGRAYEQLGDIESAEESYEKAVRYIPDFLEAKAALRRLSRLDARSDPAGALKEFDNSSSDASKTKTEVREVQGLVPD